MLLVNIGFVKQKINQVLLILFTKLVNGSFAEAYRISLYIKKKTDRCTLWILDLLGQVATLLKIFIQNNLKSKIIGEVTNRVHLA